MQRIGVTIMNEKTTRGLSARRILGWTCVALGVVVVMIQPGDRLATAFGFPALLFSLGVLYIELVRVYGRITKLEDELGILMKIVARDPK